MISIAERKQIALEQRIAALTAELDYWLQVTEENQAFEKHHTQVRALTGHLRGLQVETLALFEEAKQDGTVLADARNIESLVLGLRRIWEFFRSKLVQRREPRMRSFLQAADELAWACYGPVLDRCTDIAGRQPPLVFLNGGLSPYALSRDQAFRAEDVPGEALTGKTYDPILEHLPVAVIGVPWYQVAHIPDLPVVAHETGHAVEQDFHLHEAILRNLNAALGAVCPRLAHWQAWSREVFADLWGCLTLGPAYVSSLVDFLAGDPGVVENELSTTTAKYPTAQLRVLIACDALDKLGFNDEAVAIAGVWRSQYPTHAMPAFEADAGCVVDAILGKPFGRLGLTEPLTSVATLRFSANDWTWAKQGADERAAGRAPETANTIVRWAAAARYLYDLAPDEYAKQKHGDALIEYAGTLIQPGTRAGEAVVSTEAKRQISDYAVESGRAWFSDFAAWTKGSRRELAAPSVGGDGG